MGTAGKAATGKEMKSLRQMKTSIEGCAPPTQRQEMRVGDLLSRVEKFMPGLPHPVAARKGSWPLVPRSCRMRSKPG